MEELNVWGFYSAIPEVPLSSGSVLWFSQMWTRGEAPLCSKAVRDRPCGSCACAPPQTSQSGTRLMEEHWLLRPHLPEHPPHPATSCMSRGCPRYLLSRWGRCDRVSGTVLPPPASHGTVCRVLSLSGQSLRATRTLGRLCQPTCLTGALKGAAGMCSSWEALSLPLLPCSGMCGRCTPHWQCHTCVELILAVLIRKWFEQLFFLKTTLYFICVILEYWIYIK